MLCSVITKNSNWKILTKNLCAMGWRMKNFNIFWVHAKIRVLELQGVLKKLYTGGLPKKGEMDKLQIKRGAYQEKGGGFEGGRGDTTINTMLLQDHRFSKYSLLYSFYVLNKRPF